MLQSGDGVDDVGLGRIEQDEKSKEGHAGFVSLARKRRGAHVLDGNAQRAKSLPAEIFEALLDLIAHERDVDDASGVRARLGAGAEHVPERALGHQQMGAVVSDENAQPLAQKVIGNLVGLRIAREIEFTVSANGYVDGVGEPRLVKGVEVRVQQHDVAGIAFDIQRRLKPYGTLRQGACLVAADHVHAAEILDRSEPLHDDLSLRHPLRTPREIDADDRRQQLRRQADRKRQRKEHRVQDRALEVQVDGEDSHHQNERHLHQEKAEPSNTALKFGLRWPQLEPFGDLAEFGPLSGDDDPRSGASADHVRSHPQCIGPLGEWCFRRQQSRHFLGRVGFTGESGLVDEQVLGLLDQAVAWNEISSVQDYDVPGDNRFDRNVARCAVAKRGRFYLHDRQQPFDRLRCAVLLPEPEQPAHEDNGQNDERVDRIVQEERQGRREQEEQDDRTLELAKKKRQCGRPRFRLQSIRAVAREPLSRVLRAQAVEGDAQLLHCLCGRHRPEGRRGLGHAVALSGRVTPDVAANHRSIVKVTQRTTGSSARAVSPAARRVP